MALQSAIPVSFEAFSPRGAFVVGEAACGEGLIDAPIYEAALGALRAQVLTAPQTSRPIPGPASADE